MSLSLVKYISGDWFDSLANLTHYRQAFHSSKYLNNLYLAGKVIDGVNERQGKIFFRDRGQTLKYFELLYSLEYKYLTQKTLVQPVQLRV